MSGTSISIGSVLAGRYRLEAVLGSGGMSTVYRALDESLGRTVAIKVFRDSLSDAKALERQRSEVQLIASFEHPSLVTLFDAVALDETREHAFLVMQFVDGDDLGVELARGPLGESRAIEIGADVANALAYVHEQGVIHRDVKPGNILVPREPRASGPRALLADFGIARFLDGLALTATGSVLGTANYLSPEQALGQELTTATDVYSLGLVLIEAVSGERAFPGSGMESVAARIGSDPALPSTASEALAALLRSMTARDPAVRPTAIDVEDRLRGLAVTAELPETVALAAVADVDVPDATTAMPAAYAPTRVMPAADATTSVLPEGVVTETRRISPARIIAVAAIVIVVVVAVVLAIALPRSTPASVSTPSTTSSSPSATSVPTSVPTTAAPVVGTTPSAPAAPVVTTVPPGKDKPGKGNNGHGHGPKP